MSIEFTQETERPHVAHLRLDFNELNLLTVAEADELRDSVLAVPEEVAVLTIGAEQPAAGEAEIRGLTGGLNLEWAHSLGPREGQELLETL
jgi:enoyl-CoA hydratase